MCLVYKIKHFYVLQGIWKVSKIVYFVLFIDVFWSILFDLFEYSRIRIQNIEDPVTWLHVQ